MKHGAITWGLLGSLLALLAVRAETPAKPGHWAFQPVRDSQPPTVHDRGWGRTSVDPFILAPLEAAGIRPTPPADRRTFIRRATYDLLGLPPTAEEIEAFVADASPGAEDRLLDRLLDSPHYGEQWGRHWLDIVRYADTAGETADYPVPMAWRYRNYVLQAFNTDKPYDEFLREQLAGDILARRGPRERYAERVTATGYLAISRRFGFDSENYHHLTIQDTIDNLGQGVLGLTLGCARCHAHKYDPVSLPDYYGLYGIFDSTRYAFPGSEQKQKHRALVPLVPPEESQPQWRAFEQRVAALVKFLEQAKAGVPSATLRSLDDLDGDFEMQAPAAGGSKGVLVPPWIYDGPIAVTTEAQSPFKNLHPGGRVGASLPAGTNAYRITQTLHPRRSRTDGGRVYVNLDFRLTDNPAANDAPVGTTAHRFWLGHGTAQPAVEILVSAAGLTLRTGEHAERLPAPASNAWHNLQLTLDLGAGTVAGSLGRPEETRAFAARRLAAAWDGVLDAVGFEDRPTDEAPAPGLHVDNLAILDTPVPPVSTVAATGPLDGTLDVATAKKELERLLAEGPFELAYAVSEGTPHDARIQQRGEPDRPGHEVPRGFLQVLGGGKVSSEADGSGRLALAGWITDPQNPLTARVMVNRVWHYHFGQGLVKTLNDFGTRGQKPSHPELLDHLATQFVRSGWSLKALHRLIMGSATYHQQSRFSAIPAGTTASGASPAECPIVDAGASVEAKQTAPHSAVSAGSEPPFSPFTRRRLSAEETRDAILRVSGLLDPTPGEGHPFPAPTGWGYTQHGPFSAVYDHSRRSVYLMTQRIKRHPFLALFDGADPNASTAERRTTTVPTQALYFLNDPFVHTNAERLAQRILAASGDEEERIRRLFREVLAREPEAAERTEGREFLATYRAERGDAKDAATAALAAYARVLLGSNEFLTVD